MKKTLIFFSMMLVLTFSIINYFLFPLKYKNEIQIYAKKYDLNPALIASVINAESSFNKHAKSSKGAVGLMQILPTTAEWIYSQLYIDEFNKKILTNENYNIQMGCFYLSYLENKFTNLTCLLCAYNAGESVVTQWLNNSKYSDDKQTLKKIPYNETSNYVKKIQNYIKVYSVKF